MSPKPALRIKADRFLLPVLFPVSQDLQSVLDALREKMGMAGNFLRQASLVVDLGDWQGFDAGKLDTLLTALRHEGLRVLGLRNVEPAFADVAHRHNAVIFQQEAPAEAKREAIAPQTPPAAPAPSTALVVEQPVRAGQQIYARGRDLVLLHGVNVGGEVLADGNIHVYGRLAGRALAGAAGDVGARIFTSQMEAQLLSIAGHFMLQDHPSMEECRGRNVGIRLRDEEILFDILG